MSALTALLRGRGAHPDPLRAVDGLSAALAGTRPPGFPHTVWQLLFHINFWIAAELACIETADERHPPDHESWPTTDAPPDEAAWQAEVGRLREHLAQLDALANARASTRARIVHQRAGVTVEDVLWALVAHQSYHAGQIVQLRKALGAWPPATA